MSDKGKKRRSITFDMNDSQQALAFQILNEKGKGSASAFVAEAILTLEGLRFEKIKKMLNNGKNFDLQDIIDTSESTESKSDGKEISKDVSFPRPGQRAQAELKISEENLEEDEDPEIREIREKNIQVLLGLRH